MFLTPVFFVFFEIFFLEVGAYMYVVLIPIYMWSSYPYICVPHTCFFFLAIVVAIVFREAGALGVVVS